MFTKFKSDNLATINNNKDGIYNNNLKQVQMPIIELLHESEIIFREQIQSINFQNKENIVFPDKGEHSIRSTLFFLISGLNNSLSPELPGIAIAVEMLHYAIQIHRDFMVHSIREEEKKISNNNDNAYPVLFGDLFFIESIKMINSIPNGNILSIMLTTVKTMLEGQFMEVENHSNFQLEWVTYDEIIKKTTSSLFAGISKIVTILGKKHSCSTEEFYNFGLTFGGIIQIKKDLQEILTNNSDKYGIKALKEGKISLPFFLLYKNVPEYLEARSRELNPDVHMDPVEELKKEALPILNILDYYKKNCLNFLKNFPPSPYKKSLLNLLNFLCYKEY